VNSSSSDVSKQLLVAQNKQGRSRQQRARVEQGRGEGAREETIFDDDHAAADVISSAGGDQADKLCFGGEPAVNSEQLRPLKFEELRVPAGTGEVL
jgi:hypothetical protein